MSHFTIADEVLNGTYTGRNMLSLTDKEANAWIEIASHSPIPKMLCNQLWHEGELCFLFADTNVGKSILAVQIADNISNGTSDGLLITEAPAQKVLYLDFELSAKQFQNRYSCNYTNPYVFSSNLIRVELNTEAPLANLETVLFADIEKLLKRHQCKVLIVDNITYLKTQSTDTAKEALPLMNMLISLKRTYGLSILVLTHTPKRNGANPITLNDMAGSKHLSNFADSVFAIGQSAKGGAMRYIKHLKARATEKTFDEEYVMVCRIEKNSNFLRFNHLHNEPERLHLTETAKDRKLGEQMVREIFEADPEMSLREIGRQTNMSHRKVGRIIEKIRSGG